MLSVNLLLREGAKEAFLINIDETIISKHSSTVREALKDCDPKQDPKKIYLFGVAFTPLRYILEEILRKTPNVHFKVAGDTLFRAVVILQVVNALGVEPKQYHIEGYVTHYIANNKLVPEDMGIIEKAFGPQEIASKPWRVMIHQLAYDVVHQNYTDEEREELAKETDKHHPNLKLHLNTKVAELELKAANYQKKMEVIEEAKAKKKEFWKAKKEASKVAAKERKAAVEEKKAAAEEKKQFWKAQKEAQKAAAEEKRLAQEKREQKWWEEANGFRPASADTVDYVLRGGKPAPFLVKVKSAEKGKKGGEEDVDEEAEGEDEVEDTGFDDEEQKRENALRALRMTVGVPE
ncbi:hypothetical protein LTR37_001594 [Vermiconidia calcicola]|uniref:Uncharacterized protein n=1 Tax=Vermiconidia calcicola TaxID=1690605 RepID=A0ACC3NVP1_9PEZI|nr:hypothetical protein LTR37_001594 [Vermiconidia calcicola]